jgi:predicted acetyltransferase
MTLWLVPPSLDNIAGYAAALEAGWSPDTLRDLSLEHLALYRRDPALLIDELTRRDGMITIGASTYPCLPSRVFWLDDGEFCGTINVRFVPGSDALPPPVPGHVGYAVVPWKRQRGYATEALRLLLPVAHEIGLKRIQLVCDADNEPSQRVIAANGGVLDRCYRDASGKVKLSFSIDLFPAQPS